MSLRKLWKEAKHVLAFVLAIALFFNGWANYDFSVFAANELTVTLSENEAVYTGSDLTPLIISVEDDNGDVTYDESDVTWTDENGQEVDGAIQNAGVYTATVSVTEEVLDDGGNPTGEENTRSGSAQFTVSAINLSTGVVNVSGDYTYTGSPIEPTSVSVTVGSTTVDPSLYSVEVSDNLNVGDASVKVKAVDNNENVIGETTGTFKIAPVVFDVDWNVGEYEYDGKTVFFPTAMVGGVAVEKCNEAVNIRNGVTVTLTTNATIEPKDYIAQLALNDTTGNYKLASGLETRGYTVGKRQLTEADVVLSSEESVANGSNQAPTVIVTADGKTLTENTDYVVTKASEMIIAGTYDIKVEGRGNYQGEVTKSFVLSYAYDGAPEDKIIITGNTLAESVYRESVTLVPAKGYVGFSTEELGTYETTLVYDENTTKPSHLFLKDESGNISKVVFPSFSFDNVAPTLEIAEPDNNNDWTSEKEITITDKTGADYGVFYTTDANKVVPDTITDASALSELTRLDDTRLKCSAEATYYFYAVDNAGFVTSKSVIVKNIDTEAPTISVKTNSAEISKTTYTNVPIELTVVFSDEGGSEIDTDEIEFVDDAGNEITLNATANANEYTYKYEPATTERKIFTINVKDNAENPATAYEFEIYYDIDAPTVENSGLVTADGTAFNANEWINADTEDIYLSFKVTDEITDVVTSGIDTITVVKDGDDTTTDIAWEDGTTDYSYLIPVEEDYEGTYTVKVLDKAGNLSEITQAVKVDTHAATFDKAPEIHGTSNGLTGNDLWYNAEEVTFTLSVEDTTTGVAKVVATTDANVPNLNDETENEIVGKNAAGSSEYVFTVEDTDFQLREYYFYAVDAAGNMSVCNQTVELRRDSQLAKTDSILFAFSASESDLLNSVSKGEENKIYGFINSVKNIFVKTKIKVTFYVEDTIVDGVFSGVNSLKFEYNGKAYEGELQEGYHAYVDEDKEGKTDGIFDLDENASGGYSVFTCEIPVSANNVEKIGKRINITEVKDLAGNSCAVTDDIVLADDNLIIIDDVAPELTVTYQTPNGTKDSDETYFYNAETTVDLEIKELNFSATKEDGGTEKATVVNFEGTNSMTGGTGNSTGATISVWDESAVSTNAIAKATVTVPAAENTAEVEHKFSVKYQDPSGNLMKENGEELTDGQSTSKTLVIDTLAPELKEFKITDANGDELSTDEGLDFAQNVVNGDDVKISITIDDNAAYFNSDKVKLYYDTDADGKWKSLTLSNWSKQGRECSASCTFDGAKDEEHTYRFKVVYSDMAQNPMENNGANVDEVGANEPGAFISKQQVVIDHSAPKMITMEFTNPINIFDGEKNDENGNSVEVITDKNSRIYYDANAEISFDVDDKYLKASDMKIKVYDRADKLVDFSEDPTKEYSGDKLAGNNAFKFIMPDQDAEYYFTVSYTDRAGNQMVYSMDESEAVNVKEKINEAYDNGIKNGTYTSPIIIRDTVTPTYKFEYTDSNKKAVAEGTNNSVASITALVNVTEMNLDMEKTKIYVTAKDINGNDIGCEEVTNYYGKSWNEIGTADQAASRDTDEKLNQRSLTMTFATEANYTIRIDVVDKVTKKVAHTYSFCIDRTVPEIKIVDKNGEHPNDVVKGALVDMDKSDISYTVINDGTFSQILNKLTFGYFAKAKIRVQIKAHDQISGVKNIIYTYSDVNGNSKTETTTPKVNADDKSCSVITFELPISFKGQIQAFGIDNTGNSAVKTPSGQIGVIAETESKHMDTSKVNLEVLTNYSKTKDYYNGDVDVKFTSADEYSGLFLIKYTAGNDLVEDVVNYGKQGVEIVTSAIERNYTIKAATNNENNIVTGLMLEDNAGYTREIPEEELPKIHIDTTAPKVEVEYDNNDSLNEKYYKEDRIATVTVTERNFDPDDVLFDITGPNPSISSWSHTAGSGCTAGSNPEDTHHSDSCRWSCNVHFSEDGDYTFGFSCIDLAGNEGKYDQIDEFTIDKTIPEITVVYNNNDFQNEYYYKEARIATITINEHNFSSNDVLITMTASDDGRIVAVPGVSGWTSEGDIHKATIRYDYDAEFTFDIEFMDLAGNLAAEYDQDHFVVDQTAPELEIFDIEHMSANNGVVRPGIRYHDTNYDQNGTVILMTGYHNGVVEMTGDRKLGANGLELKLDDFAYVQEMDDIYTMEATVYDLAGNSSEAMVMFSVNRFGSVYTFDEATDALIGDNGKYYTNKEQQLVITETNVDTLEFKEITLNLNGKLTTLKEGVDYTVALDGNDATWKQYTYTLKADNFVEEGTYILTIYSEDRATNTSDNNTKGKKIEFVVDKTNPSALISGVENGGQYRMHSKEMTIDIEDNVRLSSVTVTIDGVETVYDAAQIQKMDGKLVLNIGSANHWQDVVVEVTDAAGNTEISEEMRVLVTANIFVQFFMNKPVFYGTLGGTALLAALLWWFLVGKKKKEEQAK